MRPTQVDTLRQALTDYLGDIDFAQGYDPVASRPNQTLITEAVAVAKRADMRWFMRACLAYESEGLTANIWICRINITR